MQLLTDAVTAVLICAVIVVFMRGLRSLLTIPVSSDENIEVCAVIKVYSSANRLEQTVKSLESIKDDGKMIMIIEDHGMDWETRKIAEILASKREWLSIHNMKNDERE